MKSEKKLTFQPGWRRWTSESDKPVTLPSAPWDAKTEKEDSQ